MVIISMINIKYIIRSLIFNDEYIIDRDYNMYQSIIEYKLSNKHSARMINIRYEGYLRKQLIYQLPFEDVQAERFYPMGEWH